MSERASSPSAPADPLNWLTGTEKSGFVKGSGQQAATTTDQGHDMFSTMTSIRTSAGIVASRVCASPVPWLTATHTPYAVTFGFKANHQRPTEASP